MEHMSLMLFSICLQIAIGIMVFVAIGRLMNKKGIFKNAMFVAAGLGIIGMLASLLHLGQPLRAVYALNQFASSWLSREIWFAGLFVGLTLLALILLLVRPQNKNAINATVIAAAVIGLIETAFMALVYTSSSVPLWQGATTLIEFYAATISMGAIIFLLLSIQEATVMKKLLALVVATAVIIQAGSVIANLINLSTSTDFAIQGGLTILSGMLAVTVVKWLFILVGAFLLVWIAKDEIASSVTNFVVLSAVLLLVGQSVGRYLFYLAVISGIGV